MASNSLDDFDFPHFTPPPQPNNPFNPHPHPFPPPTPVMPPSPSPNPPTAVIIVVISFGCIFLLGAILLCMWWFFIKRRKGRKEEVIHERKDIEVDEHLRVQEMVVRGCCGRPKKVLVSVDEDVRVHEDVHKDEVDMVGKSNEGSSSQPLSLSERQV